MNIKTDEGWNITAKAVTSTLSILLITQHPQHSHITYYHFNNLLIILTTNLGV
jgi:hypothetical protein